MVGGTKIMIALLRLASSATDKRFLDSIDLGMPDTVNGWSHYIDVSGNRTTYFCLSPLTY